MAFNGKVDDKSSILEKLLNGSPDFKRLDEKYSHLESYFEYLDREKAKRLYGQEGLRRYYAESLDLDLSDLYKPTAQERHRTASRFKKGLAGIIGYTALLPFKIFSKTYEFILRKTGNHLAASGVAAGGAVGAVELGVIGAASYTIASTYPKASFYFEFLSFLKSGLPFVIGGAALAGVLSMSATMGILSLQKILYHVKKDSIDEIKDDIREYTENFYRVWRKYESEVSNYKLDEVGIGTLDAVYSLVTSKVSPTQLTDIKEHDKNIMPAVSSALGKKTYAGSIIHKCPPNLGGITLVPAAVAGFFMRKHVYNFVFVNKERRYNAPNYDFPVAHELAHAAGHIPESMANAYALRAMKRLNEQYPMNGYDLFIAVNKLGYAVGALKSIIKDKDRFDEALIELKTPKFILDVLESDNYSYNSAVPPICSLKKSFSLEAWFIGLYTTGAYVATKKLEKKVGESFY